MTAVKTRTYNYISCFDLDELVSEALGKPWSYLDTLDGRFQNDIFLVEDSEWDDVSFPANLIAWMNDEPSYQYDLPAYRDTPTRVVVSEPYMPCANEVLGYLVEQGKIPGGDYLIEISW